MHALNFHRRGFEISKQKVQGYKSAQQMLRLNTSFIWEPRAIHMTFFKRFTGNSSIQWALCHHTLNKISAHFRTQHLETAITSRPLRSWCWFDLQTTFVKETLCSKFTFKQTELNLENNAMGYELWGIFYPSYFSMRWIDKDRISMQHKKALLSLLHKRLIKFCQEEII